MGFPDLLWSIVAFKHRLHGTWVFSQSAVLEGQVTLHFFPLQSIADSKSCDHLGCGAQKRHSLDLEVGL